MRLPAALLLIASSSAVALVSASAQTPMPTFNTTATSAYMKDLSNGAVLYAKGADTQMPPASMAKMMSVYVAFDMLKRGDAKLEQKVRVRPETWAKWHSQGSTMFLSANEEVSVSDRFGLFANQTPFTSNQIVIASPPGNINISNTSEA